MDYYYQVMPLGQINEGLTYKLSYSIQIGSIVEIPLRKKKSTGVIISQTNIKDLKFNINKVLSISNVHQFAISAENLDFYKYVSKHCFIDLGMILKMAVQRFPDTQLKSYYLFKNKIYETQKSLINKLNLSKKDWQKLSEEKKISQTTKSFIFDQMAQNISLNSDQEKIFKSFEFNQKNNFQVHLVDGVTGSGKTELYLKAVESNLDNGNQSLILLPEIALTEEWSKRFFKYFGCRPFIWHSKQSKIQKARIMRSLLSGEPCVLVGARSSVLLPFKNLKLIICDEEHDSSYKQEEGVILNSRDWAVLLAKKSNCKIILSTATPSIETQYNCDIKKYSKISLTKRVNNVVLPEIKIIDMRKEKCIISDQLSDSIKKNIDCKHQTLIFINKRGYSSFVICKKCGFSKVCEKCNTSLSLHNHSKNKSYLLCHHCNYKEVFKNSCQSCEQKNTFIFPGLGIEKIAEVISNKFPVAKKCILSSDIISSSSKFHNVVSDIVSNKALVKTGILPDIKYGKQPKTVINSQPPTTIRYPSRFLISELLCFFVSNLIRKPEKIVIAPHNKKSQCNS